MAHTPDLPHFFEENINLEGLFDILSPKNNLVLADDMMLSDADGIILRVSENYERNFGFTHDSIVGKSAFDLEANGTFRPCITAVVIRQKKKITATQTINHTHKNVMTVGIPLFDQNGVLKYAVCFNTVSMEQINTIQQNYRHLQDSLQQYTQEIAELRLRATATDLVVKSPAMQRLWTLILNTANTKANILITGETGVGKSAVAKAIHAISNRANGPFIEVNCAVLHENLIESELFGYEKGAFTGAASAGKIGKIELANHGTLFLDEVGEISMSIQTKLLRVLQERQVRRIGDDKVINIDVRIISATNKSIQKLAENGEFRRDLVYRLDVLRLFLPPLREREGDVELLFLNQLAAMKQEMNGEALNIGEGVFPLLRQYPFMGNIRELRNIAERVYVLHEGSVITLEDMKEALYPTDLPGNDSGTAGSLLSGRAAPFSDSEFKNESKQDSGLPGEEERICQALHLSGGNKGKAAKLLGIDRSTLWRRMKKYGLEN